MKIFFLFHHPEWKGFLIDQLCHEPKAEPSWIKPPNNPARYTQVEHEQAQQANKVQEQKKVDSIKSDEKTADKKTAEVDVC